MYYVIAYDIGNDKRRNRVARVLQSYGDRIQESVFECRLGNAMMRSLKTELEPNLGPGDKLSVFQICVQCRAKSFSWRKPGKVAEKKDYLVVT